MRLRTPYEETVENVWVNAQVNEGFEQLLY